MDSDVSAGIEQQRTIAPVHRIGNGDVRCAAGSRERRIAGGSPTSNGADRADGDGLAAGQVHGTGIGRDRCDQIAGVVQGVAPATSEQRKIRGSNGGRLRRRTGRVSVAFAPLLTVIGLLTVMSPVVIKLRLGIPVVANVTRPPTVMPPVDPVLPKTSVDAVMLSSEVWLRANPPAALSVIAVVDVKGTNVTV